MRKRDERLKHHATPRLLYSKERCRVEATVWVRGGEARPSKSGNRANDVHIWRASLQGRHGGDQREEGQSFCLSTPAGFHSARLMPAPPNLSHRACGIVGL